MLRNYELEYGKATIQIQKDSIGEGERVVIIGLSVKKPVAMSMFLSILIFLAILVSFSIPVDLLPKIESPVLTVSTSYSGAVQKK